LHLATAGWARIAAGRLSKKGRTLQDIFIVGSPRSGTTWLQTLIASHPDVASPPELYLFPDFFGPCDAQWAASVRRNESVEEAGTVGNGLDQLLDRAAFVSWMRDLYTQTRESALALKPGANRLSEKTPHNARYLPLIREVVPGARFVHIVRDPKDVVTSLVERSRRPFGDWAPSDVVSATGTWLGNVRPALRDGDPADTMTIRYEDLKADVRGALERVAEFAGLHGALDEWLDGDPQARAAERGTFIVRRPERSTPATGGQTLSFIGAPTTSTISDLERWYVESRCFAEMAEFGYQPSVFDPDRASPGRRAEVALRVRAPQLARRVAARARRELDRRG
jgi:hypothetical protein